MSLSGTMKNYIYKGVQPSDTVDIIQFLKRVPNSAVITESFKERRLWNKSKEGLPKQVTINKNGLASAKKSIDNEYSIAPRVPSRLPRNVIQYWINTGYLPYQSCMDNIEYSDTGSSLSEEECLYETHATTNTMNTLKLNNKQLCNDSSTNSSVDTAAYILSNINITRKENICSKLIIREITNMHKDRNYKNGRIINAVNIYDTMNSNISKNMCISDVCTNDNMCKKDKLEKTIIKEQNEIELSTPYTEDINAICKGSKILNKNNLNSQIGKGFSESIMEKTGNISNNDKQISHLNSLHNDFISQFRQRKLYTDRDSPTPEDIALTQYKKNDVSSQKRFLHPALEDDPTFQKPHRRFIRKRKHTFLNNFISKKQGDSVTSDNKKSNDTDEEIHIAKRQKTVEDIENNVNTDSLNCTAEKSYQLYNVLLRKQLRQISAVKLMHKKKLKSDEFILTRNGVKKIKQKEMKDKTALHNTSYNLHNTSYELHNTSYKMHNPVIALERLSKETIKHYTKKKDLQSEIQETNDIQIKNITQNTNKFNSDECSLHSIGTVISVKENVFLDSMDSDASTIIIFNCQNAKLSAFTDLSLFISNKTQLEKMLKDEKLTEKKPVVVLERLCSTKPINKTLPMASHKKKELKSFDISKSKLEPVVALERLILDPFIKLGKKSSLNTNSFTRNGFNKTNANKKEAVKPRQMQKENAMINEKTNQTCKNNKRLLYFQTNTNDSDSDSDSNVSFSLLTNMKSNTTNEIINKNSSNPLGTNTPDSKSIKNNKKVSSRNVAKQKLNNKRTLRHDSNEHALTNNKSNALTRSSSRKKVSHLSSNVNKIDNSQQVCSLADVFENDTSKKLNIYKNNNKNVINKNMNVKTKRFTLCTKAYDSDSD